MFAKSLIAAAALAGSAIAFSAPEAAAKTNWDIHIGLGGFGPAYVEPYYAAPVYVAPSYDYDTYYDHEPRRRHVERRVYVQDDSGVSCRSAKRMLRTEGFYRVEAYDCSGPTYGYSAVRDGDLFKVRVDNRGNIVSVRQID